MKEFNQEDIHIYIYTDPNHRISLNYDNFILTCLTAARSRADKE